MLVDEIYKDYVNALKSKNRPDSEFLSFIRSELKNQAINLRKEKLEDEEALSVLKKQQKRLLDTKESIASSGRADLAKNIENELDILNQYLPKPLQESEVLTIIEKVISNTGASSMKDMGRVMKEVLSQVGTRADSKVISLLVKNKLSAIK